MGSAVATGDDVLRDGLTGLTDLVGDDFFLRAGECTDSPRGEVSRTDVAVYAAERDARDDRLADDETESLRDLVIWRKTDKSCFCTVGDTVFICVSMRFRVSLVVAEGKVRRKSRLFSIVRSTVVMLSCGEAGDCS